MTDQLTVRLFFRDADESMVVRIAEELRAAGFQIFGSSMRGITASASREIIEHFFKIPVSDAGQLQFGGQPNFDRLPLGPNYRAYFPRPPEMS
jgi:hypothetical protein